MNSILTQAVVEHILKTARTLLVADGHLHSVLFLRFGDGRQGMLHLHLPEEGEKRPGYMVALGAQIQRSGRVIDEAVIVLEGWVVLAPKPPFVAPSQHPNRQEAIVVCGRNADNTRMTSVVQPFLRDAHDCIEFEPIELAQYDQPVTEATKALGLIDFLFLKTD